MHSAANVSQQLRQFDRANANAKMPPGGVGRGRLKGHFVKICTLTPFFHLLLFFKMRAKAPKSPNVYAFLTPPPKSATRPFENFISFR
jgi:hypothetical protein